VRDDTRAAGLPWGPKVPCLREARAGRGEPGRGPARRAIAFRARTGIPVGRRMRAMRGGMRSTRASLLAMAVLLAVAALAAAQPTGPAPAAKGFLLRVEGDASVQANETVGGVLVVNGTATVAGDVGSLVVVNGTAVVLGGGKVGTLVVTSGVADLRDGALVRGDVTLVKSTLTQAPGAQVQGSVNHGESLVSALGRWAAFVGILVGVGVSVALVVAGLLAAAFAPRQFLAAGAALTGSPGATLLSAAILWIGVPILAILAFATLVGIPTALGVLFLVLPLLWFFGYVVVGIRVGELLLHRRRATPAHPYLGALVGVLVLVAVSWIPFVGGVLSALAGFVGGGAVALVAWRSARSGRGAARPPAPAAPQR